MDKNKLLKVLDMPEKEQRAWVGYFAKEQQWRPCTHTSCHNHKSHPCENCGRIGGYYYLGSLADLAFRLRDEAGVIGNMHKGIKMVCKKASPPNKTFIEWWAYEAQPIHWIIASLIAKEANKNPPNTT